jgi:uncharacterized protein
VLNPVDFSRRAYFEAKDRFPDRLGIICSMAYELDKSGDQADSIDFFSECARRGNAPSMIYLAEIYESGAGVPADIERSTEWTRQAAETGWSSAQYLYGMALIQGHGVVKDVAAGERWVAEAAAQGDRDALSYFSGRRLIN